MDSEKELMQNEKQTITTELLGLRAGLSMISQYTDEIRHEEEKMEEIKKHKEVLEAGAQRTRNAALERIYLQKRNIWNARDEKSKLLQSYEEHEKQVREIEGKVKNSNVKVNFWPRIGGDRALNIYFAIMSGFLWVGVVLLIYPIRISIAKSKEVQYWTEQLNNAKKGLATANQQLTELVPVLEQQIKMLEEEIQAREAKLPNITKEMQSTLAEIEANAKKKTLLCKQRIATLAEQARTVNKALQETYGVFLNESDWQNIDLIVHYMETGRADTLKEALYQVDRQRQNDRIVDAIREAKAAICSHIESAFSRMGQALTLCFEKLDMRIQGLSAQLAESQKAALDTNNAMLARLDTQISATQANTALLEKANASSDELIRDLRYNQRYWVK